MVILLKAETTNKVNININMLPPATSNTTEHDAKKSYIFYCDYPLKWHKKQAQLKTKPIEV